MKQTWDDLLFAHWEIAPSQIRDLIPTELEMDTFEGKAWIAVVPFGMSGIRLRGLPEIPGTSCFPEINVRTYVIHQGKPGVYFFSLDASNWLAVTVARRFFRLPYYKAAIRLDRPSSHSTLYLSQRTHSNTPTAEFRGSYAPVGPIRRALQGSLEYWLTERYCLYTVHRGIVFRGDIHHEPWPLQHAEAEIRENTLTRPLGISLPDTAPLLHFSKKLDVLLWPLRRC